MVRNYQLKDSWEMTGKTVEGFFDQIQALDEITICKSIRADRVKLMSYDPEESTNDSIGLWCHQPDGSQEIRNISKKFFADPERDTEGLKEELETSKMMLDIDRRAVFVSTDLIGTLVSRCHLGGQEILIPSIKRDAYMAEILAKQAKLDQRITLVYRTKDHIMKAFAMHSGSYGQIRQTILRDVLDELSSELGTAKVHHWLVAQNISQIVLLFPEKAVDLSAVYGKEETMVPALYLGTSDTGDASITAMGGWMIGDSISYEHIYTRIHRGNPDPETICKNIRQTIFSKYTELPDRLAELLKIPVEYPEEVIEKVMKESGIKKILGLKLTKDLIEAMKAEISPAIKYTGFNLALSFLNLPCRVEHLYKRETELVFRKKCGQVPYLPLEQFAEEAKKKAEFKVTLTA